MTLSHLSGQQKRRALQFAQKMLRDQERSREHWRQEALALNLVRDTDPAQADNVIRVISAGVFELAGFSKPPRSAEAYQRFIDIIISSDYSINPPD